MKTDWVPLLMEVIVSVVIDMSRQANKHMQVQNPILINYFDIYKDIKTESIFSENRNYIHNFISHKT